MKNEKIVFTVMLIFSSCILFNNTSCNQSKSAGKTLSKKYCASCHVYPDPQLLPKSIWKENILPTMAGFANLYIDKSDEYHKMSNEMIANKLPFTKNIRFSISTEDWNNIVDYYLSTAPDKLKSYDTTISTNLTGFDIVL